MAETIFIYSMKEFHYKFIFYVWNFSVGKLDERNLLFQKTKEEQQNLL